MGCPIQWLSKLQANTTERSMKAKYTALNTEILRSPLHSILSITSTFVLTFSKEKVMKIISVHEQQSSKAYTLKHERCRTYLKPKQIDLQYLDTTSLRKADMLNQCLPTILIRVEKSLVVASHSLER